MHVHNELNHDIDETKIFGIVPLPMRPGLTVSEGPS